MKSPEMTVQRREVAFPQEKVSARILDEAIRMECGDVVYEILSRRRTPEGLLVSYRALPLKNWEELKLQPKAEWPLIPQKIRNTLWARRWRLVEGTILGCLGVALVLGVLIQIYAIATLTHRAGLLPLGRGSSSFTIASLPQEGWARLLNSASEALAAEGAEIVAFDFSPQGGTLRLKAPVEAEVEAILRKASEKNFYQTGEGQWSYRE